jgi:hypothetical protein
MVEKSIAIAVEVQSEKLLIAPNGSRKAPSGSRIVPTGALNWRLTERRSPPSEPIPPG